MDKEKNAENGKSCELELARINFYKSLTMLVRVIIALLILGALASVVFSVMFMPYIVHELFF